MTGRIDGLSGRCQCSAVVLPALGAISRICGTSAAGSARWVVSSFSEPTDLAPGESGPRLVVTAVDDGPGTTEGATAPITTFAVVPDAAFSSFKLRMYGGTKGLFVHSEDICHPLIANGAGKHEKHAGNKHRAAGRHEVSHG